MKKLNIAALLFGAILMLGLGATSASAEGMKCGAGKCGSSMKVPASENKGSTTVMKCGSDKKASVKCGTGKCGSDKKASKKQAKCGDRKCG